MNRFTTPLIALTLLAFISGCAGTEPQAPRPTKGEISTTTITLPEGVNYGDLPPEIRALISNIKPESYRKPDHRKLETAIQKADLEAVETILDAGVSPKPNKNSNQESPIRLAARTPHTSKIIKLLIARGADPDNPGYISWGNTPLQAALTTGYIDNARALVEAGADLAILDNSHRTPLMLAYNRLGWASDEQEKEELEAFINYLVEEKGVDPGERYKDPIYLADNAIGMSVTRLAGLPGEECFNLLDEHNVEYQVLEATGEVQTPVLVKSAIKGVQYKHTGGSKKFSVMDCRLVAALIGLSSVLDEFEIREVHHMRAHSPGARISGGGNTSGHHYGLALDISKLITNAGEELEVVRDWHDRRYRAEVCEDSGNDSEKQTFLRKFICRVDQQELFTWILTPHYNKAHYDHFHVEIREGEGSILR